VSAKALKNVGKVARARVKVVPVRLQGARRSASGVTYLFAENSEGEGAVLVHDPAAGEGDQVRFSFGDVPAGTELPVGDGGGTPDLPCFRFRRASLERSTGQGYEVVGPLPATFRKRKTVFSYLAQGAFSLVVFPLAAVTDLVVATVGVFLFAFSRSDLSGLGPFLSNL
jgi:hypothetical protein